MSRKGKRTRVEKLTGGQVDLLLLKSWGLKNDEIADILCMTRRGVQHRGERILDKLGARNLYNAIALGYQFGYLN